MSIPTVAVLLVLDRIFGPAHCDDGTPFPAQAPHDFCAMHGGAMHIALRGYFLPLMYGAMLLLAAAWGYLRKR